MHGTIHKPKKGLTLKTITALVQAAQPGMWTHQRGLCLAVSKTGSAFWALRYSTKTGRRLMTLEPYEPIDAAKLKALEWTAADYRKQIKAGRDPLAERNATVKTATAITRQTAETFEDVARDYITQHKDGWKGHKHHDQWVKTLSTFAYPIIGKMAPHEITTNDVLDVLRQKHGNGPFWTTTRMHILRASSPRGPANSSSTSRLVFSIYAVNAGGGSQTG
jgi:hypothetical protein